ncbi:hypothetical protein OsI_33015 [Oryza sativa Indica Group]|uniref:Uncharacterized protein n=1 Tax=Oryza sativa subsp. indica TaxID=39946 RepID=A2Z5T6_ORYSI|nr:hypothetical protein OsI_33015 [Oryza sativa Indica Group]
MTSFATTPNVPNTITVATVLPADANNMWNDTQANTASSSLAVAPLPPPFPFPRLESDAATKADGVAFASVSLQDSGMAVSSLPPLTNQDSQLLFLLVLPIYWEQHQQQLQCRYILQH